MEEKIAKKPKAVIFGNNIEDLLDSKEMTKKELSDLTGLSLPHLSIIISNQRMSISLPVAMKIAEALDEPVEKVFIHEKK